MRVGSPCDGTADLAALRRRIAALERRPAALESATDAGRVRRPWPLGVDALDGALPEGGLASDGLHEAAGASAADGPAAAAFLAALLARRVRTGERGPVLVCQSRDGAARFGRLHGPGWRDLGLEPADLLVLRARREKDVPCRERGGAVLARLDRALGRQADPIVPMVPPPACLERLALPEPLIDRAGLDAMLARLMPGLTASLERDGLGARRLALWCYRAGLYGDAGTGKGNGTSPRWYVHGLYG